MVSLETTTMWCLVDILLNFRQIVLRIQVNAVSNYLEESPKVIFTSSYLLLI